VWPAYSPPTRVGKSIPAAFSTACRHRPSAQAAHYHHQRRTHLEAVPDVRALEAERVADDRVHGDEEDLDRERDAVLHADVLPRARREDPTLSREVDEDLPARVVRGLVLDREREVELARRARGEDDVARGPAAERGVVDRVRDLRSSRERTGGRVRVAGAHTPRSMLLNVTSK
jgi:hypothetical protein